MATPKMKVAPRPKRYFEIQQALDDKWYFSLCKTKNKKLVMMSIGFFTLAKCRRALAKEQGKKNLDPSLSVVTITDIKMIRECREDSHLD